MHIWMLTLFCAESMHIRMLMCTSGHSNAHLDADSILCWINAHSDAHVHIWMLKCTFRCWLYSMLNQCTFGCSCSHLDTQMHIRMLTLFCAESVHIWMLLCTFGRWLYSVLSDCTFGCSHAHSDADCQIPVNAICMFMHTSKFIAEKFWSNPVEGSTLYQHNKQLKPSKCILCGFRPETKLSRALQK